MPPRGTSGACEQPRGLPGQVWRSVKHPASDRLCQTYHSDCRPLLSAAAWWKLHSGSRSPTTHSTSSAPPSSPPSARPTNPAYCFHHPSGAQSSPPGLQVRGCWLGQWRLTWSVCWMENVTVAENCKHAAGEKCCKFLKGTISDGPSD